MVQWFNSESNGGCQTAMIGIRFLVNGYFKSTKMSKLEAATNLAISFYPGIVEKGVPNKKKSSNRMRTETGMVPVSRFMEIL